MLLILFSAAATYLLPLNSFSLVFLLFLFQHQFNKQLLKFLITVIDAKLLKAVVVKDLKAIDIKHSNHWTLSMSHFIAQFSRIINPSYNPCEKTIIHGLKEKQ